MTSVVFLMTIGCTSGGGPIPSLQTVSPSYEDMGAAGPPVLWGYVYRVHGQDTILAPGAQIWAEPGPVVTLADSVGYWELGTETNLRPARYTVWAEQGTLQGSTREILAQMGSETGNLVIYLGAESHIWEPIEGYDPNVGGSKGRVLGRVRCCLPQQESP